MSHSRSERPHPPERRFFSADATTPRMGGSRLVGRLRCRGNCGLRLGGCRPQSKAAGGRSMSAAACHPAARSPKSSGGPAPASDARRSTENSVAPRHRPVVLHHPRLLVTQHLIQRHATRKRPMEIARRSRGDCVSGTSRKLRSRSTSAVSVRWKRSPFPCVCGRYGRPWLIEIPSRRSHAQWH